MGSPAGSCIQGTGRRLRAPWRRAEGWYSRPICRIWAMSARRCPPEAWTGTGRWGLPGGVPWESWCGRAIRSSGIFPQGAREAGSGRTSWNRPGGSGWRAWSRWSRSYSPSMTGTGTCCRACCSRQRSWEGAFCWSPQTWREASRSAPGPTA